MNDKSCIICNNIRFFQKFFWTLSGYPLQVLGTLRVPVGFSLLSGVGVSSNAQPRAIPIA